MVSFDCVDIGYNCILGKQAVWIISTNYRNKNRCAHVFLEF